MFLHLSVILFTGGRCRPPRQTPPGQTSSWADSPRQTQTPSPESATAEGGTHPTGMHSCFFFIYKAKQECIPVECVLPALHHTWGLPDRDTPPWTLTSLDRDPLDRDPPCKQTNTCENSTLPQTSFTDGKN